MKKIAALLALCASTQGALAAGADCRAIEGARERLACYDAASLPKRDKPAAVESDASRAAYQDPLVAEDARTAAKLKIFAAVVDGAVKRGRLTASWSGPIN